LDERLGDLVSRTGNRDLSLLVEAAPVAMIAVDGAGRVTLVNAQAERLFGYRRDELLGGPIERLVPEGSRGAHIGLRGSYLAAPVPRVMGAGRDLFGLRKDGTEVPIEIGLNPIATPHGEFVLAAIIDITERKRAEEHLRLVIEAAPNAMLLVDKAGSVSLTNAQTQRLFGYTREELIGKAVEQLVPERFRSAHPGLRGNYFAAPTTRVMGAGRDLFGLRKDGSEVPIEIGLNPITTPQGDFVLAAIIDITELKRSEEHLRLVFEAAPNAMILVDKTGSVSLVNAQTERLFGYTREEVLGKSVDRLVPERFRVAHPGLRGGYFAAPTTRSMGTGRDLFGLRKDGSEVPIEIGLSTLRIAEDTFVLAAIIDITERKRAELLRTYNAEFGQHALAGIPTKQLMQEAAELIARVTGAPFVRMGLHDAVKNEVLMKAGVGWPIELVDEHTVDVSQSPQAQECLRTGKAVLVERIDVAGAIKPTQEAIDRGTVGSATIPIHSKAAIVGLMYVASTRPLRLSADEVAFLDAIGTIIGLAIDRDQHEHQITRLNSELQQRYDEMESFNYSVAHDLRAPLRAVAGFATVLEEDYGDTLDAEAKRYLGLIDKGAAQMGLLIDALLGLARVGRQEISRSSVDLSALAEAVTAELREAEPARNVVVTIQPRLIVSGDPAMLRLVLQNLLSNAWKFTRDRDPASIAFSGELVGGEWTYCVKDNGVGFSSNTDLFQPFKRLHGRKFEGTGIGLATVARIILRHGGRIWAESVPEVGSSFCFTVGEVTS
jgi:PAS domain S-box-containing protein